MTWQIPPGNIAPDSQHIDVWRSRLDVPDSQADKYAGILSHDEKARADRYAIASKRRQFIVGRGLLRRTLGLMLDTNPRSFVFRYGTAGKPELENQSNVQFNVSHSGNTILMAITLDQAVGIDLEQIRPRPHLEAMTQRFFAPEESDQIMSLEEHDREKAFYHCWCRKEAILKGAGLGIWIGLDKFAVNTSPDDPPKLLRTDWGKKAPTDWHLTRIDVADDYAAALAHTGPPLTIRCWDHSALPTAPTDARDKRRPALS